MNISEKILEICAAEPKKQVSAGKIIFKTAAITAAILAFVPTVIKLNKGRGFDAYGLLSHVKYEKSTGENGERRYDVSVKLVDLERYGVNLSKKNGDKNEDSVGIAECEEN